MKIVTTSNNLEYRDWLRSIVLDKAHLGYRNLIDALGSTPFIWLHPLDKNRGDDGHFLRTVFFDLYETDVIDENYCSVLEMILSICNRIGYELDNTEKPWVYFWEIMGNLGLADQDDANFDEQKVEIILRRLLNRTYKKNGEGSMFPVKNPREDFRKTEIWYQMQAYIDENYPI